MLKKLKIIIFLFLVIVCILIFIKYYTPTIINDYRVNMYYNSHNIKDYYGLLKI